MRPAKRVSNGNWSIRNQILSEHFVGFTVAYNSMPRGGARDNANRFAKYNHSILTKLALSPVVRRPIKPDFGLK